jgi:hypothetical protein
MQHAGADGTRERRALLMWLGPSLPFYGYFAPVSKSFAVYRLRQTCSLGVVCVSGPQVGITACSFPEGSGRACRTTPARRSAAGPTQEMTSGEDAGSSMSAPVVGIWPSGQSNQGFYALSSSLVIGLAKRVLPRCWLLWTASRTNVGL